MPHKDPDANRAYHAEYKTRPNGKLCNKFYDAAKHANERAAKYGCVGTLTGTDVRAVLLPAVCFYCGREDLKGVDLTLDHRLPLHLGGPNTPVNIVCSCQSCNKSKKRADRPRRWAQEHEACVACGGTDRPHSGGGLCDRCYQRAAKAAKH